MVFLDTSFIAAYYNKKDVHHEKAKSIMEEIVSKEEEIFISNHVFDEIINVLLNRVKDIEKTKEIGNDLKESTEIIHTSEEEFESAWKKFRNQKDTNFSFTDCSIISLAKNKKLEPIATFDKEFKKLKEIGIKD